MSGNAEGKRSCREEHRGPRDLPGAVAQVRLQATQVPAHHGDATQRWGRGLKMAETEAGEWPAPGGSVADIGRPQLPTGVVDFHVDPKTQRHECVILMVGTGNGGEVVVKAMAANGVLLDTGGNFCMADSEINLVQVS